MGQVEPLPGRGSRPQTMCLLPRPASLGANAEQLAELRFVPVKYDHLAGYKAIHFIFVEFFQIDGNLSFSLPELLVCHVNLCVALFVKMIE